MKRSGRCCRACIHLFPIILSMTPALRVSAAVPQAAAKPTEAEAKAVRRWIKDLASANVATHRAAAGELVQLGPKAEAAIPALLDALKHKDNVGLGTFVKGGPDSTRYAVVEALLRIGPKGEAALLKSGLPVLIAGLKDPDAAVREHTARAIRLLGVKAEPALPALLAVCREKNFSVRDSAWSAVRAVGPKAVPDLVKLLGEKDREVRKQALDALSAVRPLPVEAVPALVEALKDPDPAVRWKVVQSLAGVGPEAKAAVPALIPLLKDDALAKASESYFGEEAVAYALIRIGMDAVPDLLAALGDSDFVIRGRVAGVLGRIGAPAKKAVPKLRQMLANENKVLPVLEAAAALIRLGDDPRAPRQVLGELLRHEAPGVRWVTLNEIGRLGDRANALTQNVIARLDDADVQVRAMAVETIRNLGPGSKAAVPALAKILGSKEPELRVQAALTLEQLGPEAREAAPALAAQLLDRNVNLVARCAKALAAIGPGAADAMPAMVVAFRKSKDDFGRSSIVEVFHKLGPLAKDAAPALIAAVEATPAPEAEKPKTGIIRKDGRGDVEFHRDMMIEALGAIGPASDRVVPFLLKALDREDWRPAAAEALIDVGPAAKAAVPRLRQYLGGNDFPLAARSAVALARITGEPGPSVEFLLKGLRSEPANRSERWVRAEGVRGLGRLGPLARDAIPALVRGLQLGDDDQNLRWAIINALGSMGPAAKEAVPHLLPFLDDVNKREFRMAAEALGNIGPDAEDAVPRLIEVIFREDQYSARFAAEALHKILPE